MAYLKSVSITAPAATHFTYTYRCLTTGATPLAPRYKAGIELVGHHLFSYSAQAGDPASYPREWREATMPRQEARTITDEHGKQWVCEGQDGDKPSWIEFRSAEKETGDMVKVPPGWRDLSDKELLGKIRTFLQSDSGSDNA